MLTLEKPCDIIKLTIYANKHNLNVAFVQQK